MDPLATETDEADGQYLHTGDFTCLSLLLRSRLGVVG